MCSIVLTIFVLIWWLHRYIRKADCSSFVMCLLLALALLRVFLLWPLTVLIRPTRQAVCAIKQSFLNMMSMGGAGSILNGWAANAAYARG